MHLRRLPLHLAPFSASLRYIKGMISTPLQVHGGAEGSLVLVFWCCLGSWLRGSILDYYACVCGPYKLQASLGGGFRSGLLGSRGLEYMSMLMSVLPRP